VIEGARSVELFSSSHCAGGAPWNVVRNGALFVQYDASVAAPLYALLAVVDPTKWSADPPRVPRGHGFNLGSTPIDVREPAPAGVKRAPSRAAACARSTEASEAVRAAFGGVPRWIRLSIECDVRRDPTCRRTEALGRVMWRGSDLTLAFACIDDVVDAASFAAQLAAVKPLVDSKVVAAWNAVATTHLRIEPDGPGQWRLRSGLGPDVRYSEQSQTVHVQANHQATDGTFWTALGIDPSTRVYEGPEGFESNRAHLDLAGRVLP
jgi:hypothetical protein